ncbi:hypothetical protein D3C76_1154590 [compost metagenome]|uniref:hypothetical protein n=1 Tax=Pseudomonas sp. LF19 TaxID=2899115 RepID=UPI000FBEF4EE|nr:hypothetical protein [Pseudomonas sp. LF19]MCE5985207.1 hypothetical protein [Pseudomonas sp. LF19]
MTWKGRFWTEFWAVLLLGCLPVAFSYWYGNVAELTKTMDSLLSSGFIANYSIALSLVFFAVAAIERFLWKRTEASRSFWAFVSDVFTEVGTGLIVFLRLGVGAMIAFPTLWFFVEPESFELKKVVHFYMGGVFTFFVTLVVSYGYEYVKIKWRRRPWIDSSLSRSASP